MKVGHCTQKLLPVSGRYFQSSWQNRRVYQLGCDRVYLVRPPKSLMSSGQRTLSKRLGPSAKVLFLFVCLITINVLNKY